MSSTSPLVKERSRWIKLDEVLREDAESSRQRQVNACGDPAVFAELSDLDVACMYMSGPSDLQDAMYCELHQRGLAPWKITQAPALDVSTGAL